VIKGLTYAIVTTEDVPRARRFFTEKLGLATEDDMADSFSQFTTRAGTMWALSTSGPEQPAGVQLFLEVEDVDAAYRLWQERGVEMVSAPSDAEWGRGFAFRGPDGQVLHAWRPAA
jgi:predicted enzyme related to lactoylglutathione lyase